MDYKLIKDNLFIAAFMGAQINNNQVLFIKNKKATWQNPRYSESWDWLKPAVQLCEKITNSAVMETLMNYITDGIKDGDIKKTFDHVVAFMRCFNDQTPRYYELTHPETNELLGTIAIKNQIIPEQGTNDLKLAWHEFLLVCEQNDVETDTDSFVEFFNSEERDHQIVIERVLVNSL